MICIENFYCHYYEILIDTIIDYKELVFITRIKANVSCSINNVLS